MDPLFGFIDDLSIQHQPEEENATTGVGEYTISYPSSHSEHYQLQHSNNAQLSNVPESSAQLVHVVSENAQNEKQIYVIKLENFLKDEGNSVKTVTVHEREGAFVVDSESSSKQSDDVVEDDSSSESSSGGEDENEEPVETDQDMGPEPDPFLVVAPEAVMAMAQSVGVELNEDDASELGCLTINKLRSVVLMAMQFAQNENSEGITVEHFTKAEEQFGSPGIGQESVFRETAFKYAGGVCIIDDGPEIDLYASIHQENISELSLDDTDPILNVHHLRSHDHSCSVFNLQVDEESLAESFEENKFEKMQELLTNDNLLEAENSLAQNDENDPTTEENPLDTENENENGENQSLLDELELEPDDYWVDDENEEEDDEEEEEEDDDVVDAVNKLFEDSNDAENVDEKEEDQNQKLKICNSDITNIVNMAPEWVNYLQMLIEQIVGHAHSKTTSFDISSDFKRVLKDIRQNGVNPIFHILCDMFRDYLKEDSLTKVHIMNMLSVVDALLGSNSELTFSQMTDLGCFLIEVIILPPPCEVHHYLTDVFMKILKDCNELLTWTCTYITESLKGILEVPFEELKESFKSTMHGTLCLMNGLELQNIQVAQEFCWHSSVLKFSENHAVVFDGEGCNSTLQDSFLEEEILKFYYNFMKKYTNLVPPMELSSMRESVITLYGERFLTFAPPIAATTASLTNTVYTTLPKNKSLKKTRCVFRKIIYKDKEIIVPYRKILK